MLGSTLPPITDADALTIDGPGAANLTISGNNAVSVLVVRATLNLQDVTIANGSNNSAIAGFDGTLNVTNSAFSNNNGAGSGGAIHVDTLNVSNSTFSGNSAKNGGAIFVAGPTTVTNSTFSGNSANALAPLGGQSSIYQTHSRHQQHLLR